MPIQQLFMPPHRAIFTIAAVFCLACANAYAATAQHHAKVISQAVPSIMVGDTPYVITIEMKNAGSREWTTNQGFHLTWRDPAAVNRWGDVKAPLGEDGAVAPGESTAFTFQITAPPTEGRYDLAWQMVDNQGQHFGEVAQISNVIVENPTNRATSNMQMVPNQVKPGERFNVIVQFNNAGKTTWNREAGYVLANVDGRPWNVKQVDLPGDGYITPGETATFRVDLTAPRQPGEYRLQWQMRQGNDWFGQASNPVYISVGDAPKKPSLNAEFVYQDVPQEMHAGENYTVSVQFKNTGEMVWTPQHEQLAAINPENNLNWTIDRVNLNSMTRQGEFYTFRFTVRAPAQPGNYNFQWRMLRDGNTGFGKPSENIAIQVVQNHL